MPTIESKTYSARSGLKYYNLRNGVHWAKEAVNKNKLSADIWI